MARKSQTFEAPLETGHKGAAVIVPFDPATTWHLEPHPVASAAYGTRPGHLVRGTLNGVVFDGWIGQRWGRHFVLVDEKLRRAAGARVGDLVKVTLEPRAPRPDVAPAAVKARRPRRNARR